MGIASNEAVGYAFLAFDPAVAYRLRVGDYRILYAIVSKDDILVFNIARREKAYD